MNAMRSKLAVALLRRVPAMLTFPMARRVRKECVYRECVLSKWAELEAQAAREVRLVLPELEEWEEPQALLVPVESAVWALEGQVEWREPAAKPAKAAQVKRAVQLEVHPGRMIQEPMELVIAELRVVPMGNPVEAC